MDITLPLHAEEGMRAQLEHALASHGLHGRSFRIGDAADPLPGPLLSALRLQCMTPAELYLHCGPTQRLAEGATSAVAFVSAHNEWHALRRAVELTSLCPAAARVAQAALAALCERAIEEPLQPDPHDGALQEALNVLGGRVGATLASCRCSGRGLVSSQPLAPGEAAVSLPEAALLSAAAARATPALAPALREVDEGAWTEHVMLMLLLMHERRR
jgi:hypothetical protein